MMNRILMTVGLTLALGGGAVSAAEPIRILTENTELVLQVAGNGRLYQTYLASACAMMPRRLSRQAGRGVQLLGQ